MSTKRPAKKEMRRKKPLTGKQKAAVKNIKDKEAWLQKELESVVQPKEIVEEPEVDSDEESEQEDIADLPFIPIGEEAEDAEEAEEEDEGPRVVYLGHLPFGFEEYQMEDYFKQFGTVKRAYVSRSKKSGHTRGFGFVEFVHSETAQIAADTMNDYLMFKKRLVCRVVPKTISSKIKWPTRPITSTLYSTQRNAAALHNSKNQQLSLVRLVEREDKKRDKLRKLGINYEFDGYKALVNELQHSKRKREEEEGEEGEEMEEGENPQKRPREEEGEKEGEGEEEGEGEGEGEGEEDGEEEDEGESEEDEEALWDARKQAKISADLTGSQKRKLLKEHLIVQTRKNKKEQKANGKQHKTPTPTPAKETVTPAKETTPKTPAKDTTQKTPATTKTPAKETVTSKTPTKETPLKTPTKQTTPKTPAKETTQKTPAKQTTPAKETATPKTPAKETKTPAKTPAKEQKTPAGKAASTPSKPVSTPKSTPAKATPQSKKKKSSG